MDELVALDEFHLVPVIELEPQSNGRSSPERGPSSKYPDEWERYWRDCLADQGIVGLRPVRPGSWHVQTAEFGTPRASSRCCGRSSKGGAGSNR